MLNFLHPRSIIVWENVLYFTINTLKNARVDPDSRHPYLILVCLAKSSADSIGDSILSTVRKAARLAVYELIMIKVKNHHIAAIILVETDLNCIIDKTSLTFLKSDLTLAPGHCPAASVIQL